MYKDNFICLNLKYAEILFKKMYKRRILYIIPNYYFFLLEKKQDTRKHKPLG